MAFEQSKTHDKVSDENKKKANEIAISLWRGIVKEFINQPRGINLFPDGEGEDIDKHRLVEFTQKVGYLKQVDEFIEVESRRTDNTLDEKNRLIVISYFTECAFDVLKKFGYLESETIKGNSNEYARWTITGKGVDVALKLLEHEDNNNKYIASFKLNLAAFLISISALVFTATTTFFNYQRLDLYEKQVLKFEQSQVKTDHAPKQKNTKIVKTLEK
ncbi:hypothetical protein ACT3S9_18540 [Pseudoalteromonas sp. AOP31-A2-14]|uniref:hypothetical protein n=1 Tax=Pseudoalteromonas TaxID=53246 RepID=UPI003F971004